MLTKRTNILFDEELWKFLAAYAATQNTSIGDLVRVAVRKVYVEQNVVDQRKRVCESILATRKKQKGRVNYEALINYGRKYL